MYLGASGSPVLERVAIDSPAELGATLGQARRGHRGGVVFVTQRMLNNWVAKWRLPLAPLEEDGVFGSATEQRVRAFQRALELTEDGVAGRVTRRWLDQVVGFPLAVGPAGSPGDAAEEAGAKQAWAARYAQCFDMKTAGLRNAVAAIIGAAAFTGLTMDRVIRDKRILAVLQQLSPLLLELRILTPKMQEEIGTAARASAPVIGWVGLDIVLRLAGVGWRCAADLEWPPRRVAP